MTEISMSLYKHIGGMMECGFCDDKMHHKIATSSFDTYENILNMFAGQVKINMCVPTYSMYRINIFSQNEEHYIDMESKNNNIFHTAIQADDDYLFLNCLSTETTCIYLSMNTNNKRYVFVPLIFNSEINESGHFTFLIFDVLNNKVYIMDPNGESSFFNDVMILHAKKNKTFKDTELEMMSAHMIINSEQLINIYIKKLNIDFGLTYEFISRTIWNPLNLVLNKHLDNSGIPGGNCVIISTILMYYLINKQSELIEPYKLLSEISSEQMIQIINGCSVGMCNIMNQMS
jgi:hypothetical protein